MKFSASRWKHRPSENASVASIPTGTRAKARAWWSVRPEIVRKRERDTRSDTKASENASAAPITSGRAAARQAQTQRKRERGIASTPGHSENASVVVGPTRDRTKTRAWRSARRDRDRIRLRQKENSMFLDTLTLRKTSYSRVGLKWLKLIIL